MSCRTVKTKPNISQGKILRNFIKSIEGTRQFNIHARQSHPLSLFARCALRQRSGACILHDTTESSNLQARPM